MSNTYSELLRDPRWQKKRLEILQRDSFTCQECTSTTATLHVHHRYYISKRAPWDYLDSAYVTLCEECHESVALDQFQYWETILGAVLSGGEHAAGLLACEISFFKLHGVSQRQGVEALAFWLTTKEGADFVKAFNPDATTADYYKSLRLAHGGPTYEEAAA